MIRIRCINPYCTAPDGIFVFDEKAVGTAGPSKKGEQNAQRYAVECPFCGTLNMVWLNNPKRISIDDFSKKASVDMDMILVKKGLTDFK
jgi:hypothetical protein